MGLLLRQTHLYVGSDVSISSEDLGGGGNLYTIPLSLGKNQIHQPLVRPGGGGGVPLFLFCYYWNESQQKYI